MAPSTIDETLRCSTALIGGFHTLTVQARTGTGRQGSRWYRPAFASVGTGGSLVGYALDSWFAWSTAGNPTRDATVVPTVSRGKSYPLRTWGTLAWHRERCRRIERRVPLTGAGLTKRTVGGLEMEFKCSGVPQQVLVRVHGTLAGDATPSPYSQFVRITVPLSRAQIAVRTTAGRPLAYTEVLASGKARLLTARTCISG
jgi:hypothetical protein